MKYLFLSTIQIVYQQFQCGFHYNYLCCKIFSSILKLKNSRINVITADYSKLVKDGCRSQAVQNTVPISKCIAEFINRLLRVRCDIHMYQIHIIGHSMGAQIAGQSSHFLKMGQKYRRMSGLDPSYGTFYTSDNSTDVRITEDDAQCVDILHANIGGKGEPFKSGKADFIANNGKVQPDCAESDIACSHNRAVLLYASSINPANRFLAVRCSQPNDEISGSNFTLFGEYYNCVDEGNYYFKTSANEPYTLDNPVLNQLRLCEDNNLTRLYNEP